MLSRAKVLTAAALSVAASPDGGAPPRPPLVDRSEIQKDLPDYPRRGPVLPVGDNFQASGALGAMVFFDTPDAPEEVLHFYWKAFTDAGLFVTGAEKLKAVAPFPGVTAVAPGTSLQRTVMVVPRDSGSTVFLSVMDMNGAAALATAERFGGLPAYPGAQPLSVRNVDREQVSTTVSFRTEDPAAKVIAFYESAMSSQGWRRDDRASRPLAGGAILAFRGQGGSWDLTVTPAKPSGTTLVATHREGRAEP